MTSGRTDRQQASSLVFFTNSALQPSRSAAGSPSSFTSTAKPPQKLADKTSQEDSKVHRSMSAYFTLIEIYCLEPFYGSSSNIKLFIQHLQLGEALGNCSPNKFCNCITCTLIARWSLKPLKPGRREHEAGSALGAVPLTVSSLIVVEQTGLWLWLAHQTHLIHQTHVNGSY